MALEVILKRVALSLTLLIRPPDSGVFAASFDVLRASSSARDLWSA
jgi:hypothetical protein